jgi:endonuclease G
LNAALKISVVQRQGYTAAAEERWRIPAWVSYRIAKEYYVQGAPRFDRLTRFIKDPDLGDRFKVTHDHYTGSGFDRGHMAPHASMQGRDEKCITESYYLSNIAPQTSSLNKGIWQELEEKERYWAETFDVVWIVAGPIFDPDSGPLRNITPKKRELKEKVAIPSHFFKILIRGTGRNLQALAFVFPNQRRAFDDNRDFQSYQCTIDDVEALTNLDFLLNLEDDLEDNLEASRDQPWN